MCQKAFGNAVASLVTGRDVCWTKREPRRFRSSNKVRRGFCEDCGTPLTYELDGEDTGLAIGSLDNPELAPPTEQLCVERKLSWFSTLPSLEERSEADEAELLDGLTSHQHPDHE